jgi:uncharacterized protein (UPF0305 family)
MTDDLVKRLLDVASPLADEAAGTIHRLTAERDELYERWNDCQEKRMVAEAETRMTMAELADWTARAEAAEKELQEMQAHIDHADAYHKAMLVAEADNARLTAIIATMKMYMAGEPSNPPVTGVPKVDIAALTGKETK